MSTPPMMNPAALPRELVLASAGTGKTFRISSRIIGLLAAGSRPDAIFASTFTRKAAGEILDRVLARLAAAALDPAAAAELAEQVGLAPGAPNDPTPAGWLRLLRDVVAELHRLNIGTLDSFFIRAASSFADEVALPPGWIIADLPAAERVRAGALHALLGDADPGELIELVRGLESKDAARSVHAALMDRAEELLGLHHALDAAALDAWDGFEAPARGAPADLDERRMRLADAFDAAVVPLKTDGTPRALWVKALRDASESLRAGRWEKLIESTLCRNSRTPGGTYDRVAIESDVCALLDEACRLARFVLARRLSVQCRAIGRLAGHLAAAVEVAQREAGAFGFGDVTRLLGGPAALCDRPDLYYRLDARLQHILLDEFQDTSLAQWEALEPLLGDLLDGSAGERATVVVADPKQSIYAWRGGEPLLVRHVGERYSLTPDQLSESYRSSQEVLDAVNAIFERIEESPVFADDPAGQAAAAEWKKAFAPHVAAKTLPGHVRLLVGPEDEGSGEDRPRLCHRAAQLVAALRAEAPGMSIGVLTRKNKTVARIMLELRDLGVAASEEGGNPLTDSAAVSALLSLLRLADHPGDRIARYHVAKTPVGEVVGFTNPADDAGARRLAHRIRGRLLEEGYGATLAALADGLAGSCEPRDRRRLAQLAELGARYDARSTLRVTDFVRVVESERVEDPTAADVRVMTVHQSKGLEFDVVVLPELDVTLVRPDRGPLVYRPHPAGRITRVFPCVGETVRDLFPEMAELHEAAGQAAAARWRDALSGLYVAVTRARHAVHVLVKPDGVDSKGRPKTSTARTAGRLVRGALAPDQPAQEGDVLHESGNPRWYEAVIADRAARGPAVASAPVEGRVDLRASPSPSASPSVSPSALAGGPTVDLRAMLRLDTRAADLGTLAHAWLERIGWLEDGVPTDEELREITRRVAPALADGAAEALRRRFRAWLADPGIRSRLGSGAYPAGATVEREVPFIRRADGRLVEGIIDRVVLLREGGRVVGAEILDYKTDALDADDAGAIAAKTAHYRPQLDAYSAAVAGWYGLPVESVSAGLVFLDAGVVAAG